MKSYLPSVRLFCRLAPFFIATQLPLASLAETVSPALARRMVEIAPRFTRPSADAADVMPVGAGDLSAMLRYDQDWEIHLSKTDFFAFEPTPYHQNINLHSPGHVQLSLAIPRENIRHFDL